MREQKLDLAAELLTKAINKSVVNQSVDFVEVRGLVELIADAAQVYEVQGVEAKRVRNHNEGAC